MKPPSLDPHDKRVLICQKRYENYPDVLTLVQFCKMVCGISERTATKLLQEGHIYHFRVNRAYMIPKSAVIEFILSPEFQKRHYSYYHKY